MADTKNVASLSALLNNVVRHNTMSLSKLPFEFIMCDDYVSDSPRQIHIVLYCWDNIMSVDLSINTDDVWSKADHGVLRQYTMIRRTPYIISINNDTFLHNGNDNDLFFTPTLQCNIIEHEAKVVEFYEACHPISERETTL